MIVVLEGADGVGKSTLADALDAHHTGKVIRVNNGPPPTDVPPYLHYSCMIDDFKTMLKRDPGTLIIVDRFHVGELVYAPMFRGTSDLTLEEAREIDVELGAAGACMVHCWLPYQEMARRQITRDGGKADEKSGAALEHSYAIRQAFVWACGTPERTGALTVCWDFFDMRAYPDQLAQMVYERARFLRSTVVEADVVDCNDFKR